MDSKWEQETIGLINRGLKNGLVRNKISRKRMQALLKIISFKEEDRVKFNELLENIPSQKYKYKIGLERIKSAQAPQGEFAQNIKKWLLDNSITTYEEAGKRLNIHPSTLGRWMCGAREPKKKLRKKIEEIINK